MSLSPAQLALLKADLLANTTVISSDGVSAAINSNWANRGDADIDIATWYNQLTVTAFWGNYATVPYIAIANTINWKNYTPADAIPIDTALNNAIWQARSLCCQGYMLNLQAMLQGRATFDATNANLVQGLHDATITVLPSGVAGALQSGGWGNIQKILCRLGTNAEKVLANTSAANGSTNLLAATFTFEGQLQATDIAQARNS